MRVFKVIKCGFKGHKLEEPSIIPFLDKRNYLKKCSRCGLYEAHDCLTGVHMTIGKRAAYRLKEEFESEFGKVIEETE